VTRPTLGPAVVVAIRTVVAVFLFLGFFRGRKRAKTPKRPAAASLPGRFAVLPPVGAGTATP